MLWSNFFLKLAVVWAKNANFRQIYRRKYLKNHNIGPRNKDINRKKIIKTNLQGGL
jgi:hypothetical protein